MIKKGSTYKLDNVFLRCTKVRKNGMNIFQICDKDGNIKPPVKVDGTIVEYGTRMVYLRTNELVNVRNNE